MCLASKFTESDTCPIEGLQCLHQKFTFVIERLKRSEGHYYHCNLDKTWKYRLIPGIFGINKEYRTK